MKVKNSADVLKSPVNVQGASGAEIRQLISKADGARNFEMRMFELKPGGCTPLHAHPHEHEVFILEGSGVLVYEDAEHDFGREYVIFVPPNKEHRFKNTGRSVLRFLCLIPAGAA